MIAEDLVIANALMRQALVSIEQVTGKNALSAVLRLSGLEQFISELPPNDVRPSVKSSNYSRLNAAVEEFYGRGGRGILKRIGRASFQYGLREQTALLGLAGVALKLLPDQQRIGVALNAVANALKKTNPQLRITVNNSSGYWVYLAHTCSVCYGRHSNKPVCHLLAGSLAEAVEWATNKTAQVEETHCLACGDPYCGFQVNVN